MDADSACHLQPRARPSYWPFQADPRVFKRHNPQPAQTCDRPGTCHPLSPSAPETHFFHGLLANGLAAAANPVHRQVFDVQFVLLSDENVVFPDFKDLARGAGNSPRQRKAILAEDRPPP